MRSHGLADDQIQFEEIKGAAYVVAQKKIAGRRTEELLPEILPLLLRRLNFPRPMYWESKEIRFARPIRWLLSLYGSEPVKFSFAGVNSGRLLTAIAFWRRAPTGLTMRNITLPAQENKVVLDQQQRREAIRQQVEEAAYRYGGHALLSEALLDEVTFLVEYPVVVAGSFGPDFLGLPRKC